MRLIHKNIVLLVLIFTIASKVIAQSGTDTCIVYFAFNKSDLDVTAQNNIKQLLVAFNAAGSKGQFAVKGYADRAGSDHYNLQLSEKRIEAVKRYLLSQGITTATITFLKGYGELDVSNNEQEVEAQALNRRVEIIWSHIVGIDAKNKTELQDSVQAFSLSRIKDVKPGQLLRLKGVNFASGWGKFKPEAIPHMEELLAAMQAHPKLTIEVHGHMSLGCQPLGTVAVIGEDPSHYYAKAVINYLTNRGIDPKRLSYKGFFNTQLLVNPEITQEDKWTNQRVEIKILKK